MNLKLKDIVKFVKKNYMNIFIILIIVYLLLVFIRQLQNKQIQNNEMKILHNDHNDNCPLPKPIDTAINMLQKYADEQGKVLCLKGDQETLEADIGPTNDKFTTLSEKDPKIGEYVKQINDLQIKGRVNSKELLHVVALVEKRDVPKLKKNGYGVPVLCKRIIAFYGCKCPDDLGSWCYHSGRPSCGYYDPYGQYNGNCHREKVCNYTI